MAVTGVPARLVVWVTKQSARSARSSQELELPLHRLRTLALCPALKSHLNQRLQATGVFGLCVRDQDGTCYRLIARTATQSHSVSCVCSASIAFCLIWMPPLRLSPSFWSVKSGERACSFKESSLAHIMKVIPLSEAKANLSRYARLCHEEPVIVTVNGVPPFSSRRWKKRTT
jgi:hypothetical protein